MMGIVTLIPKSSEGLCHQRSGVKLSPEAAPQKLARERLGPGSTTHGCKGGGEEGVEGSPSTVAPLALPRKRKEGATISTLAQRIGQQAHVIQGARAGKKVAPFYSKEN